MKLRIITFLWLVLPLMQWGIEYTVPNQDDVIGTIEIVQAQPGDSLAKIARNYNVPLAKILAANPSLANSILQVGASVTIPNAYILPSIRQGIVVNLTELRLYYFPPHQNEVYIYPVALGREGWRTPNTETYVYKKQENPTWRAPESIREYYHQKTGQWLPKEVPPGPENPLGSYALYLKTYGFLIHGNNDPNSIGRYVSSGCIRLYNSDIEQLFHMADVNTPVYLIHYVLKAGWYHNELYLEANPPVEEYQNQADNRLNQTNLHTALTAFQLPGVHIDWDKAKAVMQAHEGIPVAIGYRTAP